MLAALSPKPQLITRRLGNLAAIRNPEVQTVIWSRTLAAQALRELDETGARPFSFLSLTTDPFDRVQQQLRKAGVRSHFLACDITLLVSVFGEITSAERVRVRVGEEPGGTPDFRLVASYGTRRAHPRTRLSRRPAGYAAIFRGAWAQDHPLAHPADGLWFTLDTAS